LLQGSITFEPQEAGGVGSGGVISNGTYTIPTEKGLPMGTYRVMIFSSGGGTELPPGALPGDEINEGGVATAAPEELIPAEYNVESKLTIEVGQQGPYEYHFDLVTEKEETEKE
jgi:hypothetical protein